ncbi:DnaJ domain [Macleaya cordata]|uniref:DnaJ domain n=1 Tax=Macleaya cordata TaxID=56857 RepID=A0A200Q9Y3_MACCD|nr:DnaJ domain [Macleaya cordata]
MVSEQEEEKERDGRKKKNNSRPSSSSSSSSSSWPNKRVSSSEREDGMRVWGILLFGLIGATATTFAVGQLRRTVDWFYTQFTRSTSSWKGTTGSSYSSSFKEEARRRYNRRMQEEYEEEMERVERIRRMQSVFNRERNKYKRSYESWRENEPGAYHQHFQREDWYWKTDTSYKDRKSNPSAAPREAGSYMLSHHYSVLGLDRWRTKPYTEAEIKTAFRAKAKEYHPDQNQDNKDAAEAKFKEVMSSYEAIKLERKNGNS